MVGQHYSPRCSPGTMVGGVLCAEGVPWWEVYYAQRVYLLGWYASLCTPPRVVCLPMYTLVYIHPGYMHPMYTLVYTPSYTTLGTPLYPRTWTGVHCVLLS